jgi:hypothetical protein
VIAFLGEVIDGLADANISWMITIPARAVPSGSAA